MRAVTAVIFDLWQTLIIDDRELALKRAQLRIEGALKALHDAGEEFSQDRVWEAYHQCSEICQVIHAQEHDMSFMEQVSNFIEHIDTGLRDRLTPDTVNQISTAYADSFFRFPPPLHPCAVATLGCLKEKGYLLGLISNTGMTPGSTLRVYMEQVGILGFFDVLIFSDEVLLSKPSREMFLLIIKALKIPPDLVVHVGDHLTNDVAGAKLAGLKAIWIRGSDELNAEHGPQPDITIQDLAQVGDAVEVLARGGT